MNKPMLMLVALLVSIAAIYLIFYLVPSAPSVTNTDTQTPSPSPTTTMQIANPASEYCLEQDGNLETVTDSSGGQFSLCNLENYTCEEWVFYRQECNIEEDAKAIRAALIAKGLNLNDTTVVIKKHLGYYIEGIVTPNQPVGGGGYVFAVKTPEGMKIVADGNGMIMCESLANYSEFPTFLIPQCVNAGGDIVDR